MQDDRWLAACLNQRDGDCYKMLKLGIFKGDRHLVKQAASSAIYWFSMLRGCEVECQSLYLDIWEFHFHFSVIGFCNLKLNGEDN